MFRTGVPAYNLGFIGTAYTAAHEAMELLLKLYLKRGPADPERKPAWGHDLGELFMKWDEHGRTKAELTYQRGVLHDLRINRINRAAQRATLNLGPTRELPDDYEERKAEYQEAYRQYHVELLHKGSPTVRNVLRKLDFALGARNIIRLCKSSRSESNKGFTCNPEAWYPEELLSMKWEQFSDATSRNQSLDFIQTFLNREGTKLVFKGWRYLDKKLLEQAGILFHGPPAKMVLMAQYLEDVVWKSISVNRA